MLNSKLLRVDISEQLWKEMMQHIIDGVFRKLKAASNMLAIDGHVALGLYVYAVEEFGKLLLLKNATALGNIRKINYREEFVNHSKKFETAFDYFQANGHDACLVIMRGILWSAISFGGILQ